MFANKTIILVQGVVHDSLWDILKEKQTQDIFILEGRPYLYPAKHSTREAIRRKITPTLIADNMAGFLFYKNFVKEVWLAYHLADKTGALCDIGALILGVLGKRHRIPVYLYPSGQKTKFLGRGKDLHTFNGVPAVPGNVRAYVPLVDRVPMTYITRIHSGRKSCGT
ncbi:MAG: hypothetical protein WC552_08300 [Candidatus Omnitrophota bacterium]